jgi:DNA polymerase (family 10)
VSHAAQDSGYQDIALTDHSRSLRVVGGLSIERLREQRLTDRLKRRYPPFRVLHGAEVDFPDHAHPGQMPMLDSWWNRALVRA